MLKATVVFLVYLIKTVSLAFFSYLFIYFWKYHLLNAPLKKKKNYVHMSYYPKRIKYSHNKLL